MKINFISAVFALVVAAIIWAEVFWWRHATQVAFFLHLAFITVIVFRNIKKYLKGDTE